MEIVKVDINELISPEYNPRQITDDEMGKLKNSINEFGYVDPIIVNKHNNHIVGGNQRYEALKSLGYTDVDVIFVDEPDLNREKALNIALNKISGEWDFVKLADILDDLELNDFDISLTGFDEPELEDFGIEDQTEHEPVEIVEDDYEEPDELEVIVQHGDIYILGNHRLMCGDSTSVDDVEKLMNGNKADMVFTDPPYSYNYQSNMRTKSEKFDVLMNDDKILNFMHPLKIVNDGFVFICTTWKVLDKWIPLFKQYYNLSNMIIWNKGGGGIGDLKHTFLTDYEIILCSNNEREIIGKRIGSVWNIGKDNVNDYVHPTQKPIKLSANAIKNVTKETHNVLDLFGGSGSTMIACEQLNRNCYMMELDPKYCQVIINRWEEFTGEKAEKILGA